MTTPNLQTVIQASQQARNLMGTLEHMELSIDQMVESAEKTALVEHVAAMFDVVKKLATAAEDAKAAIKAL